MKRVVVALVLLAAAVVIRPVKVSTAVDPAQVGQWSGVLPWPSIGVHSHLLNTGKVLTWQQGSQATLWDPATGVFTAMPNPWVDLLCAGHAFLSDGRLLTLGGWDRSGNGLGLSEVDIFEPSVRSWNRARPMTFKRWYPTATRLPDGRLLALSGARNSLTDLVTTPEIYDPVADTWTSLTGAVKSIPLYPFMFVLPDGRVISVGNSEVASRTQTLDIATSTWTVVDSRLIDGGSAVTFQPGKFMKSGTAADSGNTGLAATTAFVLDMTQPAPAWQPTGSMAFPRSFHNLTMLPDGKALVTGGGTDRSAFNTANGVLAAEMWSPSTGTWTTLASMVTPRLYHSTALLLPDARVLVAGGGSDSGVADQPTAEIFSPPYLFKGARPAIVSAPSTISYGTSFIVTTPDAAAISSVALIATGSVTHAFNQNQAFLTLASRVTPEGLSVTAPANANLAPPGPYMLFIVNGSGVPSVAAFVSLPVPGTPPPTQVATPAVVGLTQAAATTAMTDAGLTAGPITTASSATVPAGSVISQSPVAGTLVATGSAVSLVISSGPALVTVPNVVNSTQAAATTAISGAGLVVGAVTSAASATVPSGSVISQNPIAGTQVAPGSAVALVISTGPLPPVAVPNVVNTTQAAATSAITSAGLTVGAVTTASSATITAGSVISQNPIAGTLVPTGSAVALVISSGPAPASATVDTAVFDDGNGTAVTPAFSTAGAGELLVAFAASDGPSSGGQSLTVSGAGLTWTLARRSNLQLGTSEIWTATASSALTNVTVTATQSSPGFDQSLTVVAFTGAGGTGAVASASALTGAPTVSLTTTRANSLVYGVGNDWDRAVGRVVGTNQAIVHQWIDTTMGDTFWVQSRSTPVAAAGTVATINDTSPSTDRFNLAAIEILAATAAPVAVPNVVGLTQTAATTAITGANLTVGAVTTATSLTVPAGSVISQTPIAGTQVATGSAVALVVSSGVPQVAVPNVVGLTQTAATTAITGANLTVGAVTTATSLTVPAGSVISQTPIAGSQVATGSAVALVVSSGVPQVGVPNVVGLTQTAATTAITGADLTVGTVTTAPSLTVPAGSVISQTPIAGTQVATGSAVALVVSSNLPQVTVPNVVGLTQTAATTAITGADLTVGAVTTAASLTVPAGSVISQTPIAGTQVDTGSAVALIVSSGVPQVAVPNVVGLTQTAATTAISGADLTVGAVTTAASLTVPAGSVISQTPIAGAEVATGSAVALVVSSGLPQVMVPNVVGLTQTAASTSITDATLTVGAVTTATSLTVPAGSVISQTPIAGAEVATGSAVALVVSSGLPQVMVPNVVGLTQTAASTSITDATLTVGAVTTASSTTVPSGSVISQSPIAGTQIVTGSAVALVVSSGAPAVALAVDKVVFSDGTGARTTPAFNTTSGGELLVAFAASAGPNSSSLKQLLTVSGAGLNWTLARRVNTQFGSSEVWTAIAPTPLVNATVSVTQFFNGFDQSLTVVAFVGASGTGATGGASAATGISTVSLTTTQGGSLVYAVGNDSARPAPRTLGANQTLTHQWVDFGTNQTFWVQSLNATVANAGTVATINDLSPSSDRWNFAAVEILAASASQALVPVPNVVGATQTAASSAIVGAGLTVGAITTATSTTVPSGSIISQDPVADTQVVTGSAVALVVSSGPPQIATPDVVGLTEAAASSAISGAGLTVGAITTATSATVPSGSVITQNPIAGTQVVIGTAVALVVSSGPLQVATPNVVGLTQAEASSALTGAGLTLGAIGTASSATVPWGSIVSQDPVAGAQAAIGTAVALVVSTGAPLGVDMTIASDGSGTRVTAPFDTAGPGEVLVAFAASEGPKSSTRQTLTVSGAGLTWTLVSRANTQWGTSEIWTATASEQLTAATVTSTQTQSGFSQSLTVVAFTGAGGIGASASGGANSTAPSVSVTTTRAGSLVYGVGNDPDRDTARTVGTNQTMVHQWLDSNLRATYWVQRRTTTAGAGSILPINDTAPNGNRWNLAVVEIIPR